MPLFLHRQVAGFLVMRLNYSFHALREASTENAGKSHRQEFEGSEIRPTQKPSSKTTIQHFGGHQNSNQEFRHGGQMRGFFKHESKIKQEAPQTQVQQRTSNNFDDQVNICFVLF